MRDHGVEIYSLYQAKFIDEVKDLLSEWTWADWQTTSKPGRDMVAAQAIARLRRQANQEEAWELWYRWSVNLTPADFD